jgi:hypothetical protein
MSRISVNKLGEYLVTTSPTRRRRIISDQKHPKGAIVPHYRLAEEPLSAFMCGGRDPAVIDRAVIRLRSDRSGSDWTINDRKNTADALEAFLGLAGKLPEAGVLYVQGADQPPLLRIKGLDVSVRPQFLLRFEHRGVPCIGAVKLHFTKSAENSLERKGGEYVATLLHKWLVEHGPRGCKVMPSHCLSVDVFRREVVAAPSATARRLADVTAACEEIDAHWQQL